MFKNLTARTAAAARTRLYGIVQVELAEALGEPGTPEFEAVQEVAFQTLMSELEGGEAEQAVGELIQSALENFEPDYDGVFNSEAFDRAVTDILDGYDLSDTVKELVQQELADTEPDYADKIATLEREVLQLKRDVNALMAVVGARAELSQPGLTEADIVQAEQYLNMFNFYAVSARNGQD